MKLAIMQPYFFPYLGYFQLINAVDKFVVLDDVNYINKGWINRNRILINGHATFMTLPLQKASQNKRINEIELMAEPLGMEEAWERFSDTGRMSPNLWTDAYLAAVAAVQEMQLVSFDRGLARIKELEPLILGST